MRLFRVKEAFAVSSGFLYQGQVFMVNGPMDLPKPNVNGDLRQIMSEKYEEITASNALIKIEKFIKAKEIF